jgi:FtsP/CotA-like multicopper oxidase with cupredoxin domain
MHTHHEVNFSTDVEGLEEAKSPEVFRLRDGETHEIEIKPVRKRINDAEVRMLGYNGSIPGPTLHVDQNSEVTIEATNLGDVDATRLDAAGVAHQR